MQGTFIIPNEFQKKFKAQTNEFIPENMTYTVAYEVEKAKSGREINNVINDFREIRERTRYIAHCYKMLCSAMELDLKHERDREFDVAFNEWKENPINKTHLKDVKKKLDSMRGIFRELQEDFDNYLNIANQNAVDLEKYQKKVREMIDALLNGNDAKNAAKIIIKEFGEDLRPKVNQAMSTLRKNLEYMSDVLHQCNNYRFGWAKFLIGIDEEAQAKIQNAKQAEASSKKPAEQGNSAKAKPRSNNPKVKSASKKGTR